MGLNRGVITSYTYSIISSILQLYNNGYDVGLSRRLGVSLVHSCALTILYFSETEFNIFKARTAEK